MKTIRLPFNEKNIKDLKVGDIVYISGEIYTARDAAHKRLVNLLRKNKKLPIDLKTTIIYYCGPTPAFKGSVIGSCGPTTASRMDKFTPFLIENGLRFMIGKGTRSKEVEKFIHKYKGIYFSAYGGCGAYLSKKVIKSKLIAFPDLGPEAIYCMEVEDFPLIVMNL